MRTHLGDAEVRVHEEEVEVLGEAAAVLRHLLVEQVEDGDEQVVTERHVLVVGRVAGACSTNTLTSRLTHRHGRATVSLTGYLSFFTKKTPSELNLFKKTTLTYRTETRVLAGSEELYDLAEFYYYLLVTKKTTVKKKSIVT